MGPLLTLIGGIVLIGIVIGGLYFVMTHVKIKKLDE